MNSLIGQTVGGYRILEQIGQGGMATVYKAYQPSLDRNVAVKVLPEPLAQRPGFEQRFRREARAVAKLEHPHILAVHDFGLEGNLYYLVMRYVPAGTLKALLGRPISLVMAAELVGQMAEALDYAHGQGIVHRDVKPSNVLMDRGGWALLTDFGLARMMEPTEQITGTGVGIGTPDYMSPEQVLGRKADERSDIYSLGVVLYEMLTGRVPYEADTPMAVAMKHIYEPLPLPRAVNPSIPEGVERVVLKSMAKAPEDRYSTAGELARALRAAVAEAAAKVDVVGEGVTLEEVVTEPSVQPRRPSAKRRLWRFVGLALGLMAVAVLAWGLPIRVDVSSGGIALAWGTAPPPPPTPLPTVAPRTSLFQCTDAIGCVTIGPGEPVHIAYLLVISGPNETLGVDSRNGAEIAIADHGPVLGHDVLFTGEDGGCSAEGGQPAGTRLAADPTIIGVIGTSCSSEARVAMPLLSAAGFSVISPSNTAPDLTLAGNENQWPGYFRTAHSDLVQGAAAADFAYNSLGVRAIATIHDGSLYADKLCEVFRGAFEGLGGTVTGQGAVTPDQTDMSGILADIAAGQPELIYYPIFMPAGAFITRQARETTGLEDVYLMGADGLFSPDVAEGTGAAVEGFLVSSPDLTAFGDAYRRDFLPKYVERFGTEPISIFHAHAYDAVGLLLTRIEQVAVMDADGTLHIGRQALRDALYATRNYPGLTGDLTCSPTGDYADPVIAVYEYHSVDGAGVYPPERIWP